MSQLLQVATRKGFISVLDGATVPFNIDQGIPFSTIGQIEVANLGVINHYHQSLPFTANGRLCTSLNDVVVRVAPGGIPVNAAGLVCLGSGAISHYSAGIPYTANQQIAVN
jgi:hypothetical protein